MDRVAKEARYAMLHAVDYRGWKDAALTLDNREGRDEWKQDETSEDYDWRLIRSRLRQIRQYRQSGAVAKLVHHLRQGLHWNLGNIGNPDMYSTAHCGTKQLIVEYVDEVCDALRELRDLEHEAFTPAQRLRFFQEVALSYGRSALMLSGGATLGLFHVGVVKALFREDLLPQVMSGSSAGSIVCAIVASRGPGDAEHLLDPANAYYRFWRLLSPGQMLRRRAIMDQVQLRRAIAKNVPDLTFEQAHRLSNRIINITVSPAGGNQPPRLLNHLTFPYLYLREAVLASCAVPVLFPPVMLMTESEEFERIPYMPLLRWNDGSLKSDLPMLRLRRLHNVNHFIVSQTNPHVLPFMTRREPGTRGLTHSVRNYAYTTARSQASGLIKFARAALPFGSWGSGLDTATSILDQDYRGNVNIFPEVSLWRYANVTSNPTMTKVQRFMLEGERAAWPRMEMIRNQTAISRTLDQCLNLLEARASGRLAGEIPHKTGTHMTKLREDQKAS